MYNWDFDLAAIVIYLVVVCLFVSEKRIRNSQTKVFMLLWAVSFVTPIADIFAAFYIDRHADMFPVMFWNTIYYLSKQGTTFFFLSYILAQIVMQERMGLRWKFFLFTPVTIIGILILSNDVTGWIFDYTNGVYSRGPLRPLCFAVTIFYYVWTLVYVSLRRKDYGKRFRLLVSAIAVLNIATELYQLFHTSLLIHSMTISVSILLLYVNLERRGFQVDQVTGYARKNYLIDSCKRMMLNNHAFRSVLIRVLDYDQLTISYGEDNVMELIHNMQNHLVKKAQVGNAFHVTNSMFVINVESPKEEGFDQVIYEELNRNWKVGEMEIQFNYVVAELDYPGNVNNINEYVVYLDYFKNMKCFTTGVVGIDQMHIQNSMNEAKIEDAIVRGMKENYFEMYYQPICATNTEKFVSAEALLRLKDPEMGFISPEKFIPVAEKNGLIIQLGEWVLESVATFVESHDMEKLGLSYIEVNLSTIQCLQSNFIESIDRIMKKHHVEPRYICLEITETATIYAPELLTKNLQILRENGYLLALDDYGTGYSNLQRMLTSAFHLVKFDKEMTQHLSSMENLQNIFVSQQSMFHILGSKVVAEGVETREQFEFLKRIGCDYIQGYYFSKPVNSQEFIAYILEHKE